MDIKEMLKDKVEEIVEKVKNDKDIEQYQNGKARVQFKESLGIGFVYTIARK